MKEGNDWKKFEFDEHGGGNGAAMRCGCIGLAFFGEENRKKLIDYSVITSKMTHVNPIGWLGGLSTALFTAFAIEGIHIYKWIPEFLNALQKYNVNKYMTIGEGEELDAYNKFIYYWKTYYSARFSDAKPINIRSHTNLTQRILFYNNIFDREPIGGMGMSGYSAVIVAYDCLLDVGDKWETLVFYSMINGFDSDTIGAIAGGFFGAIYGFKGVPRNNIKYIEYKKDLINIGKILYKKYF